MGDMCINESAIPVIAQMITAIADGQESVTIIEVMAALPQYAFDYRTADFNLIDRAITLAGFRRKCDGDDDTGRTYRAIR